MSLLNASLKNLLLRLHGRPIQPLGTRLVRKPCQVPAASPLAVIYLTEGIVEEFLCLGVEIFFSSLFGIFVDMPRSSPCAGAVILVLVWFSKIIG